MFEPFIITPRLLCGLRVGNGFISIDFSRRPGRDGRTRYQYHIDVGTQSHSADDLQSGCNGGSLQQGMASLLAFLGAAAESYHYAMSNPGKRDPFFETESDMFPSWVNEWAYQHDDEISMLRYQLEESEKDLIQD